MAPAAPLRTGPRQRLGTLNKPTGPRPKPKPKKQKACCDDPKHETEDGMIICMTCGTQIAENNIVAEVTFEENAQGAATVQGGFIGEGARHARSLGSQTIRRIGGGERNSRQEQLSNARRVMAPIIQRLSIPDRIKTAAENLLDIVFGWGFSAGRRTEEVIAAAVFAACRRDKEENKILLIDIADIIKVNVFRLGEVYKDLLKCCGIKEGQHVSQELVNLEPLIMRYCKRLEFGQATGSVTADAIRIARRMRKDWIVTGRHPAGLCGASIILAARMNNFRRTVREIVFIAKIADGTVARRIDEFRRTKAASLTVNDFREYGLKLKDQHDPPILQYNKEREEKLMDKKRKRQEWNVRRETMEREPFTTRVDDDNVNSRAASATPDDDILGDDHRDKRRRTSGPGSTGGTAGAAQEVRRDADGFAIPDIPDRAATIETSEAPKRKRGRPKKQAQTIDLSVEELEDEDRIEADITEALSNEEVQNAGSEVENQNRDDRVRMLAEQQKAMSAQREKERRDSEGRAWWGETDHANAEVLDNELEAEFLNDAEVENCLLSPEESRIKEQIWVAHNEDWMRMQHEKKMMKQIADANGTNKKERGKGRKKKGKKGESAPEDADTPAETPANAAAAAAKKAAPPSKFLNFETLARIYGGDPSSPSASGSTSRAPSEAPSASDSARTGAERDSMTPAPRRPRVSFGLQSPQAAQGGRLTQRESGSPAVQRQPMSPPATQTQATEGAAAEDGDEEVEDAEEDEPGYQQSVVGYDDDDISEVQDVGYADDDDDYQAAINDGAYGTFGGDEYDDY